jgi:hypothetical protein
MADRRPHHRLLWKKIAGNHASARVLNWFCGVTFEQYIIIFKKFYMP